MFRRRAGSTPRHYLYVSDSKINMLFEDIPEARRRRIATEVRVNLKVVSATLRSDTPQATRIGKLRMVERYLDRHNAQIGTVDKPRPYFRGTMKMRWGPLGFADDSGIVFFLGRTRDQTVGLAGSRKHVWGQEGRAEFQAWSALPNIVAAIGEHISADPQLGRTIREIRRTHSAASEFEAAVLDLPDTALPAVDLMWLSDPSGDTEPPPAQNVEFLAKRLRDGVIPSRAPAHELPTDAARAEGQLVHVTIGTPIYVAQAD